MALGWNVIDTVEALLVSVLVLSFLLLLLLVTVIAGVAPSCKIELANEK